MLLKQNTAQAHLLCHKCNTDRKYAQKWGISEYFHRQACDLLLSSHVFVIITFKKSSEDRKIYNINNKRNKKNPKTVDFYKKQERTIYSQCALQLVQTYQ